MTSKTIRHFLRNGTAIAMLLCATSAYAQTRNFDVPSDVAVNSIPEFARQAGIQIVAPADQLGGVRTHAVKGSLDLHTALTELLDGTGVEIASETDQTIMLRMKSKNAEAASNDGAARPTNATETVTVTGTQIRGVESTASPLLTFDRNDITKSGLTTTEQFIQSIPENFTGGITAAGTGPLYAGQNSGHNFSGSTAVNLRGLGTNATLVLLNGQRIASSDLGDFVDISTIPLDSIERIEVLTDGASATYGSDAVAGVVNIILRNDFDGSETRVRYGTATEGSYDQFQFSELLGKDWGSGSGILNYQYDSSPPLLAKDRPFGSVLPVADYLLGSNTKNTVLGSFQQSLFPSIHLTGDGYWSQRLGTNKIVVDFSPIIDTQFNHVEQYHGTLDLAADLGVTWLSDLSLTTSGASSNIRSIGPAPSTFRSQNELWNVNEKVDGDLVDLPGGAAKLAVGGSYRYERLNSSGTVDPIAVPAHRSVTSAFAELFVPIIGESNSIEGVRRLELTAAGRYDDYSDFGSTLNPKLGLLWAPALGFNVRGTYGTSYRAPELSELNPSIGESVFAYPLPDPSAPGSTTNTLLISGNNADLKPEKATSWTVGGDITPTFFPGAKLSLTYFNTNFRNRITSPIDDADLFNVLANPIYGSPYVVRNPSLAAVTGYYQNPLFQNPFGIAPNQIGAFVDDRLFNVARTSVNGLDFQLSYDVQTSRGDLSLATSGTYLANFKNQIVPTGGVANLVNTVGNPLHFRSRSSVTWSSQGLVVATYLNYQGGYTNDQVAPSAPISNWTTVDLNASYDTTGLAGEAFDNMTVTLSVLNLFDQDPPFVAASAINGATFDPSNATPLGRFVSLEIRKQL